jgi:hypothetical protein
MSKILLFMYASCMEDSVLMTDANGAISVLVPWVNMGGRALDLRGMSDCE